MYQTNSLLPLLRQFLVGAVMANCVYSSIKRYLDHLILEDPD